MERIINSLLQMYFGATLFKSELDPYHDYKIVFTSAHDASIFIREHKWLERLLDVERNSNVVILEAIFLQQNYEPLTIPLLDKTTLSVL